MADDHVKEWNAIMAASEAAKRAPQAEAAQDIARLKEHDVQTQGILQELVKRVLALEQLQPKPKRAKVRVRKAPKKKG
jgi:ATP-dependent protease Clp ATPase subunit